MRIANAAVKVHDSREIIAFRQRRAIIYARGNVELFCSAFKPMIEVCCYNTSGELIVQCQDMLMQLGARFFFQQRGAIRVHISFLGKKAKRRF